MPADPYLEQRILSADPIELVQILYEHAIKSVREARRALAGGDITGRARAISRVIGILGELQGSLDKDAGRISQNLAALYRYMLRRLTTASVRQDDGPLAEVESLLETLGSAWQSVQPIMVVDPIVAAAQFLGDGQAACAEQSWTA